MDRFIFMCALGFFISCNAVSVFAVNGALHSLIENEAYQNCMSKVNLTDAKFKEALDRLESSAETTVPKDVLCLTKCITEETKILDSSGKIDVSVVKICNHNLKILNINGRYAGATHDAFIWRNSTVRAQLEINYQRGERNSWLLGDSGYPQEPWLMTPIVNALPGTPEYRYTQAHIRGRNCIERCIGVLKGRFLCLSKVLRYSPGKVGNIVNACAILHNICLNGGVEIDFDLLIPLPEEYPINNIDLVGGDGFNRQNIIQRYFTL